MSGNMKVASGPRSSAAETARSSSSLSIWICSSNSECSTTAEAPASSMRRMFPTSSQSGEEEATSGLLSFKPR